MPRQQMAARPHGRGVVQQCDSPCDRAGETARACDAVAGHWRSRAVAAAATQVGWHPACCCNPSLQVEMLTVPGQVESYDDSSGRPCQDSVAAPMHSQKSARLSAIRVPQRDPERHHCLGACDGLADARPQPPPRRGRPSANLTPCIDSCAGLLLDLLPPFLVDVTRFGFLFEGIGANSPCTWFVSLASLPFGALAFLAVLLCSVTSGDAALLSFSPLMPPRLDVSDAGRLRVVAVLPSEIFNERPGADRDDGLTAFGWAALVAASGSLSTASPPSSAFECSMTDATSPACRSLQDSRSPPQAAATNSLIEETRDLTSWVSWWSVRFLSSCTKKDGKSKQSALQLSRVFFIPLSGMTSRSANLTSAELATSIIRTSLDFMQDIASRRDPGTSKVLWLRWINSTGSFNFASWAFCKNGDTQIIRMQGMVGLHSPQQRRIGQR